MTPDDIELRAAAMRTIALRDRTIQRLWLLVHGIKKQRDDERRKYDGMLGIANMLRDGLNKIAGYE